jgi:NAD(P)-dependent dehydrogenase (short-subunit alcohol dehydrogenase family)
MKNKTCLITGANSGIGLETARGLAKQGAQVVMVCRNAEKGEIARQDIISSTGNDQIDLMITDLSSLAGVRTLAEQVNNRYQQLHILIHNAGLMSKRREVSADGYEMQFAVHHLAVFLLTDLLLDLLKKSAPARIINVSSMMHKMGKINFDDLQCENKFGTYSAYGQSKLAMIHYTYDLSEKLRGSGVTINALHPGAVATNIGFPGWMNILLKSPEKGASTPLYLATSPDLEGVSGKYFNSCKEAKTSSASYDREEGKRLWEVTEQLCELTA